MPSTKTVENIISKLDKAYPKPKAPLRHRNVFELLLAVILSAQCTDARVNLVTQELFPKNKACTPEHILKLGRKRVMEIIRPTGYFNSKTDAMMGTAKMIKEWGAVPSDLKKLTQLPGVGNKTAQVVQSQWFKIPAFPVDTHVHRVANRLGLADSGKNRDKTERQLKAEIPQEHWIDMHLQLIYHGRAICKARSPQCLECPLYKECVWPSKLKKA